ncbi:MAG: cobyrinate a,c-diamide synthase [Proteobacteria bacterium]|nr:cobyrinate a,c-diamide synthase [Pseudomonadota bacterium]
MVMSAHPLAPGLVIAAPASGAGKTTVTIGLMRALRRRGRAVQPFKAGPDYIDPAFHAAATGRASLNLDTWAMAPGTIAALAAGAGGDIAIAEGVMGLFDGVGADGRSGQGTTADLAALLGWPVVIVLDVAAQAATAAAVAQGLARFRDDVPVGGVLLNRVAGEGHLRLIAPGLERIGLPLLGWLPRDPRFELPERHLGLVQAGETADLAVRLDRLAEAIEATVDLDAVERAARPARPVTPTPLGVRPPGQRIAVARDRAFSFLYPHLLDAWRAAGAELVFFSPLADEAPDAAADAVWLPGGYPELHAGTLAAATRFRAGLQARAAAGAAIHGECGGYMALGQGLEDAEGRRHAMAGLLQVETSFARRAFHLGYRRGRLLAEGALGRAGDIVLGHEFHFATVVRVGDEPLVDCADAHGQPVAEAGARRGRVSGTFFHLIDGVARELS